MSKKKKLSILEEKDGKWTWIVLAIALFFAVSAWLYWLNFGIDLVRGKVAASAPVESAGKAKTNGTDTSKTVSLEATKAKAAATSPSVKEGKAGVQTGGPNKPASSANKPDDNATGTAEPAPAKALEYKPSEPSGPANNSVSPEGPTPRSIYFTEIGQTGDSFGALNALLTAVAGAFVFWAGYMQYRSLKLAKAEAVREREARTLQQFESLFFQMLGLSRELTDRIERIVTKTVHRPFFKEPDAPILDRKGAAALDSYAALLASFEPDRESNEETLRRLVDRYHRFVYGRSPSAFGPYFRLLFQTFKFIDEAAIGEEEKVRYSNIARGQISEGAVLLLAANGLGLFGHRFVPLIEKFGLLEHLHSEYREKFDAALRLGYRQRAFVGSAERSNLPIESAPLLPEGHFKESAQQAQREAEAEAQFDAGFRETDLSN
jgi:hypothetical protein